MSNYILGVDGGNTKTDFFLFDTAGTLHSHHRMGSCSHEVLGSYSLAGEALAQGLQAVADDTCVSPKQMDFAVMGLAGIDIPIQHAEMTKVVASLGFPRFIVCNDGVLGIKAAAASGCGICSINGTGTVTVGLDSTKQILQVGGIGPITRDFGGGGYIAFQAVAAAYCQLYRNGLPFGGTEQVAQMLGITHSQQWMDAIHPTVMDLRPIMTPLVQLVLGLAEAGDEAAVAIVQQVAHTLADGVLGCIANQRFAHQVEVVLAGSVWVKGRSALMRRLFLERIGRYSPLEIRPVMLEQPPAIGAVFWAWQEAMGSLPPQAVKDAITHAINCKNL